MIAQHEYEIQKLTDEKLLHATQSLARQEREILLQVLKHLAEIERRRLYCTLKCGSLYEYATKHLCYSDDQAARRIAAMRLMRELPEIEAAVGSGELNLTNLGLAQTFFRKEVLAGGKQFTKSEKYQVLMKLKGKSVRAAAQVIADERSPEGKSQAELDAHEKITALGAGKFVLQIVVEESVLKKLEHLKGLQAHRTHAHSMGNLLDELCDLGLQAEKQKRMGKEVATDNLALAEMDKTNRGAGKDLSAREGELATDRIDLSAREKDLPAAPRAARGNQVNRTTSEKSRASILRRVWQRDQMQCQNCQSMFALELDHIKPRAHGGEFSEENLRVLCRHCNQRAAIEKFGTSKMQKFLVRRN